MGWHWSGCATHWTPQGQAACFHPWAALSTCERAVGEGLCEWRQATKSRLDQGIKHNAVFNIMGAGARSRSLHFLLYRRTLTRNNLASPASHIARLITQTAYFPWCLSLSKLCQQTTHKIRHKWKNKNGCHTTVPSRSWDRLLQTFSVSLCYMIRQIMIRQIIVPETLHGTGSLKNPLPLMVFLRMLTCCHLITKTIKSRI